MTPIERAEEAKRILNSPVFRQALEDVRMGIVASMEASPMTEEHLHSQLVVSLQVLKSVKTRIEKHLNDAAVEQHRAKQDTFVSKIRERFIA